MNEKPLKRQMQDKNVSIKAFFQQICPQTLFVYSPLQTVLHPELDPSKPVSSDFITLSLPSSFFLISSSFIIYYITHVHIHTCTH